MQSQLATLQVPSRGEEAGYPGANGAPAGHVFSECHHPGLTH